MFTHLYHCWVRSVISVIFQLLHTCHERLKKTNKQTNKQGTLNILTLYPLCKIYLQFSKKKKKKKRWFKTFVWFPPRLINRLSPNFKKWSNTLKQFVSKLPTNGLTVFDHFVGLVLKKLKRLGVLNIYRKLNFKSFWSFQLSHILLNSILRQKVVLFMLHYFIVLALTWYVLIILTANLIQMPNQNNTL